VIGLNWQLGTVFSNLGALLTLTAWTLLLRRKARFIALLVVDVIISLVAFADTLYYQYFQDLISIPVLLEFFQLKEIGGSVFALIKPIDLLFVADFLLCIPLVLYFSWRKTKRPAEEQPKSPRKLLTAITVTILGLLPIGFQIRVIQQTTPALLTSVYSHTAVANQLGIIGYHANDIGRYLEDYVLHKKTISEARKGQITAWFNQHDSDANKPNSLFGTASGDNVIVIQMESTQGWVIGKKINGQEITPNLNKLAQKSMYFPNYYRQTSGGRTADAEFLSLNSLYPIDEGVAYFRYVDNQFNSLPTMLDKKGYSTAAMVAFSPIFWNREAMYKAEGFQTFDSYANYNIDEAFGLGLTDQSFFRQSVPKIEQFHKPFYSFLITLSSHGPYTIPDKYQTMNIGALKGSYIGDYIESVHYMDSAIGSLIDNLKQKGLWDHSMVVLYGDHDNGIPGSTNKQYDQVMGLKPSDSLGWYEQMKTPLIIHLPHDAHTGVFNQSRGELDLTPTILHLLGISTKGLPLMGQDVTNSNSDLVVFRDNSFTDGKYFFITNDGTFQNGICYDMATKKPVDKNIVKAEYARAQQRLNVSDDVLDGNLIPYLLKSIQH